jgi:phenylacetate-CoA ligase
MSFFALHTFPGNTWPAVPNALAAQIWAAYLELDRTQWLDRAALEAGQLVQVRTLLAHCWDNVPYYRQLMELLGIRPADVQTLDDFRRLPTLHRKTYQDLSPQFCAAMLPPGTQATTKSRTTGSSGRPLEVWHTNVVDFWFPAFALRDSEWDGIDQRGTLASIRVSGKAGAERERVLAGVTTPFWQQQLRGVIATGVFHFMDIHQDPRRQLEWLRRVRPNYVLTMVTNLEYLAGMLADQGERLPDLHMVVGIGEPLTDAGRSRIEAGFGVPVKNPYSCSEAGYLASECPEGHGHHVHAENVLLEVLDGQDRPCAPGQTGRVVLTTLHNFMSPLIRYELLDEVTVGPERCPCGRGLPLLSRIQGRRHVMLRLPDGRLKYSIGLLAIMERLGGAHQFQVVQRALDHVRVQVVPNRSWTSEHPERLTGEIQEFFGAPIRVDVELLERFVLPPGGKLAAVVSELPPPESAPG